MSLLDAMGIDPDNFTWEDLALCKGAPTTNIFYDEYESNVSIAESVDEVCARCPVVSECFRKGMDGEHGVWGGIYWNGSGKADKNRNSHKTDEFRRKLMERVSNE